MAFLYIKNEYDAGDLQYFYDLTINQISEITNYNENTKNWGKGYGTKMMEYILSDIKGAGFNNVVLWVFKENKRACIFYESHGFVLTNKAKEFCGAVEVMFIIQLNELELMPVIAILIGSIINTLILGTITNFIFKKNKQH